MPLHASQIEARINYSNEVLKSGFPNILIVRIIFPTRAVFLDLGVLVHVFVLAFHLSMTARTLVGCVRNEEILPEYMRLNS